MKTILLFPSLNSVSKDFFTGLSSDSKKTLRRSSNAVIFCAFFSILSIYLKSGQFTFLFGVWSYNTSNASNACNPLHWTLILAILSIIERTISDFHRSQYGIITLFVQYVRVRITAFVSLDSGWTYSGSIQTLKKKIQFDVWLTHKMCAITKETKPKYFLFPCIICVHFRIDNSLFRIHLFLFGAFGFAYPLGKSLPFWSDFWFNSGRIYGV